MPTDLDPETPQAPEDVQAVQDDDATEEAPE